MATQIPPEQKPQQLVTRNVCIDTSEYVAVRFAFSGAVMRRLVDLANAGKLNVYVTPVIRREVESNIGEAAQDMANAVQQMKKKAAMLRDIELPMVTPFFADYDRNAVITHLQLQFETFLQHAKVESIPLAGADAEQVFELYFGKRAPFGLGKKKSEFPDAFIVASLDRWCRNHDQKMYLVTGDGSGSQRSDAAPATGAHVDDAEALKSMTSACNETDTLIPLPRLAHLLELVTRADEQEAVGIARASAIADWAWTKKSLIAEYVVDTFPNLEFVPDDFEAEVEDVSVLDVRVDTPDLIGIDEDRATLAFMAHVEYEATVHTIDPESGIWDSEDKVMLFQERHEVTRRYRTSVDGELVLIVPPIEQLTLDTRSEEIGSQIEIEEIEVTDTTIDVPIDDVVEDSRDPSQMDVFRNT